MIRWTIVVRCSGNQVIHYSGLGLKPPNVSCYVSMLFLLGWDLSVWGWVGFADKAIVATGGDK